VTYRKAHTKNSYSTTPLAGCRRRRRKSWHVTQHVLSRDRSYGLLYNMTRRTYF